MGVVKGYFCHECSTTASQMIIAFVLGLLFSPFNMGLIYVLLLIIINEILVYIFSNGVKPRYWDPLERCGVVCSTVLGFIIGRTLSFKPLDSPDQIL